MIREKLTRFGRKSGRFFTGFQCSCPVFSLWTQYGHALQIPREANVGYFIASVGIKTVAQFADAVRAHWGVEAMHRVFDVTFLEDDCRVRKGDSARNLSAIRKFALSALQTDTRHPDRSLRRSRKLADRQPNYRVELLELTRP